jgi:hypothetical protein
MADNLIQEAMNRLSAMVKEAVASEYTDVDVRFWPYQQEGPFPYFTKRLGGMTRDPSERSEEIDLYTYTILLRMVVGHITEGYTGEIQDNTHVLIGLIEDYLRQHPMMSTDAGTFAEDGGPDYLQIQMILESHTGVVVFANSGIGAMEIGCEFTLRLPYLRGVF